MNNEFDIIRLRLILRGALDCLRKDSAEINDALTKQGKVQLTATLETLETALLWMRSMVEASLCDASK